VNKRKATLKFMHIASILMPIIILFFLDFNSFNYTWKGRAYYLFFVWLFLLEFFLNWSKIKVNFERFSFLKIFLFVFPTFFVIWLHFLGLKQTVIDYGVQLKIPLIASWPLSVEYVCLSILFLFSALVLYGVKGSANFLVSHSFLFLIGIIYLIDTLYPYGAFTPFQALVPFTTSFASQILNLMGYETSIISEYMGTPALALFKDNRLVCLYGIGWPCAGVQGLLIYTFTVIFFLRDLPLSFRKKAIIYSVGAVGAYIVNAFRIVLIYLVTIEQGSNAAKVFHDIYGGLLSMFWIITYIIIIVIISHKLYLHAEEIRNNYHNDVLPYDKRRKRGN